MGTQAIWLLHFPPCFWRYCQPVIRLSGRPSHDSVTWPLPGVATSPVGANFLNLA
jgi:hypothetical protein